MVFKQKTAYEFGISDWSSDVCASDLRPDAAAVPTRAAGAIIRALASAFGMDRPVCAVSCKPTIRHFPRPFCRLRDRRRVVVIPQIGKTSCRDRVCPDV